VDSLTPTEQVVVRRASVFAADFSREALEAVCTGEDMPQNTVGSLLDLFVEQRIVTREGQDPDARYRLSDDVRSSAREQLAACGDEEPIYQHLVDFYSALAEEVIQHAFGPERSTWIARLEREHSNVQAVLAWLIEQGRTEQGLRLAFRLQELWFEEHHTREARELFAKLLSMPQTTVPDRLRVDAFDLAGAFALADRDYVAARALKEQGLTLVRELGDEPRLGYLLLHIGHLVGYSQGDFGAARAIYQEGLEIFKRLGHTEGAAHAQANLARIALELGDFQAARSFVVDSLRSYRQSGTDWDQTQSLLTAAATAAGLALAEDAVRLAGACAAHQEALGVSQPPDFRERDGRALDRARNALAGDARDTAWSEGRALPLGQAVEYAITIMSMPPARSTISA
jgi:non-specific serine/threonine protein kinase